MEELKALEQVLIPDSRWDIFVRFDEKIGDFRPSTLAERHSLIGSIKLHPSVPEDIRVHFATAKNLLLYALFVYRFVQVAELHAYLSVEMALKEKLKIAKILKPPRKKQLTFFDLMEIAIREQWIVDVGFERVRRWKIEIEAENELSRKGGLPLSQEDEDIQGYSKRLITVFPTLRNDLAHGSPTLNPTSGFGTLELCAEVINQLFPQS
jgi:hypothetical protein